MYYLLLSLYRSAKDYTKLPMKLKIGMNNYFDKRHNKTIVFSLESFDIIDQTFLGMLFKKAFRIIHETPILDKNMGGSDIIVKYKRQNQGDSKSFFHSLVKVLTGDLAFFTITSLENSPGIIYETWKDGKAFMVKINKNTVASYYIQPEKYKFLKHAEKCQEESYYGCIAQQLEKIGFKNCSKNCMPRIFSNIGINYSAPFCDLNDTESEQCSLNIGKDIVEQKIPSNCKKSCSNLKYFGEMAGIIPYSPNKNDSNWYCFSYILTNDEFMSNVFKEYLIYDAIGMIGSVGGTLGLLRTN